MKVLLINPKTPIDSGYHTMGLTMPPMSLMTLSYLIKKYFQSIHEKCDISLIDENLITNRSVRGWIYDISPDIVFVTSMTCSINSSYNIGKHCKSLNIPCIIGGIHSSMLPEEASQYFDTVVVGEAENIITSLLNDFKDQKLKKIYNSKKYFSEIWQSDQTLKPFHNDREIGKTYDQYDIGSIQTSRGCPNDCEFCSVTTMNGAKFRRRKPEDIIKEWNSIKQRTVFIVDDNFFGQSQKDIEDAKNILKEIIRKGKKRIWFSQTSISIAKDPEALKLAYKAGCRLMLIGFESLDEKALSKMHKPVMKRELHHLKEHVKAFHKAGIAVLGAFISGLDTDVETSIIKNARIAYHELKIDALQMTMLTPLPGTQLFNRLKERNKIIDDKYPEDWSQYTFVNPVHNAEHMSKNILLHERHKFFKGAMKKKWVLTQTLKTLCRTKSLTAALFSYYINRGFYRIVERQLVRDIDKLNLDLEHYEFPIGIPKTF